MVHAGKMMSTTEQAKINQLRERKTVTKIQKQIISQLRKEFGEEYFDSFKFSLSRGKVEVDCYGKCGRMFFEYGPFGNEVSRTDMRKEELRKRKASREWCPKGM